MESTPVKPKRKILQTSVATIIIVGLVLWVAAAITTESTDNKPFLDNPEYTDQSGIFQKV